MTKSHKLRIFTDFLDNLLLNQARAGLWPAHTWFLKIDPVQIVGMRACVCVSAPKAINN